jgi:hypothetical protein
MKFSRYAALIFVALAAVSACSGDDDSAGAPITCASVCQRYAKCFDSNYDVGGCTTRCTEDATAKQEKQDQLDACNSCIADKSCPASVFSCGSDCGHFVP